MKIIDVPKLSEQYKKGFKSSVQWDDGSVSFYQNKKIAKQEIGRESGRRIVNRII